MANSQRLLRVCAGLLLPALSAWADSVRVESTPGFQFAGLKKYSWRLHPIWEKKPALAEQYSVGRQLVMSAVNDNLLARGYQSTQTENPDFYITFMLTADHKQDYDVIFDSGMYGWGGWYGFSSYYYPTWTTTVVKNYLEGLLMIDVVDGKTNQLVWRAYVQRDVREWKERHKEIEKAVSKALKKFPPKK